MRDEGAQIERIYLGACLRAACGGSSGGCLVYA